MQAFRVGLVAAHDEFARRHRRLWRELRRSCIRRRRLRGLAAVLTATQQQETARQHERKQNTAENVQFIFCQRLWRSENRMCHCSPSIQKKSESKPVRKCRICKMSSRT